MLEDVPPNFIGRTIPLRRSPCLLNVILFYTKDEATVDVGKNIPCDLFMEHLNHEYVFISNNYCHRQILQQSTQLHDRIQSYNPCTPWQVDVHLHQSPVAEMLFYICPSGCNNHTSVVWHSSLLCPWLHSTRQLSLHPHPFLPFLSLAGNAPTSSGGVQWMIHQILGQLRPIPNATVATIIWRWLEGSLERTYDWILYFWTGTCSKLVHDAKTSQI